MPITFDTIENFSFENEDHKEKLKKNKTILLGVMAAEKGVNPQYNDNFKFFKSFDLYANVNLAFSVPSIEMRHQNVDIAIVRENTEGIPRLIQESSRGSSTKCTRASWSL